MKVAFKMIEEIKETVHKCLSDGSNLLPDPSSSKSLGLQLDKILHRYQDVGQHDKIVPILKQIEEAREIMVLGIQQATQNLEAGDQLLTITEDLQGASARFAKRSAQTRRHFQWLNLRNGIILGLIVVAILAAIIVPIVVTQV